MNADLFGTDIVADAIELLQAAEPKDMPYWGCFSGGKDSVVIKELARLAGVRVEWHYSVTTVDPPELVRFISRHHKDVMRERPKKYRNMAELVAHRGFPLRMRRHCCAVFKESATPIGRTMIMGIRAAESARRRARWSEVTYHKGTKADVILPILYWEDADVWDFIRARELPYCELYDQGFKRLGCIGCPMASANAKRMELERWPFAKRLWMKGFRDLWERRGPEWYYKKVFESPEAMFEWWVSSESMPKECDMALFT